MARGPGLVARLLAADGTELAREERRAAALQWSGSIGDGRGLGDVATVELGTRLRAPQAGTFLIGGSGVGSFRLAIDGATVLDESVALPPGADVVEAMMRPPQAWARIELAEGDEVALALTFRPGPRRRVFGGVDVGLLMVQLNVGLDLDPDAELERAVAAAAAADTAIVVVGTTEEVESEGFDRSALALPGRQDELVARVAEVNPRTVVVVNAAHRCCCPGPTTWPQSCWRGSPGRNSATPWPMCCSAGPNRAGGCRRPGRWWTTGTRRSRRSTGG